MAGRKTYHFCPILVQLFGKFGIIVLVGWGYISSPLSLRPQPTIISDDLLTNAVSPAIMIYVVSATKKPNHRI